MDTLVTLNRKRGVTIVVVTYEPDIAAYTDRVVTMRDGRIISDERQRQAGAVIFHRPDGSAHGRTTRSPVVTACQNGAHLLGVRPL